MTSMPVEERRNIHTSRSFWFRLVNDLRVICELAAVGLILASLSGYWNSIMQCTFIPLIAIFPNKNSPDGEFTYPINRFTVFMSAQRVELI
jgi:hypothetical protein